MLYSQYSLVSTKGVSISFSITQFSHPCLHIYRSFILVISQQSLVLRHHQPITHTQKSRTVSFSCQCQMTTGFPKQPHFHTTHTEKQIPFCKSKDTSTYIADFPSLSFLYPSDLSFHELSPHPTPPLSHQFPSPSPTHPSNQTQNPLPPSIVPPPLLVLVRFISDVARFAIQPFSAKILIHRSL